MKYTTNNDKSCCVKGEFFCLFYCIVSPRISNILCVGELAGVV